MGSRIEVSDERNMSLSRELEVAAAVRSNERQKNKIFVLALACLGIAAVLVVRNGVNPTSTAKSPMLQSMIMEREDGFKPNVPNSLSGYSEEGSSFEGDMKITADQYKALYGKQGLGVMANNLLKAICKNGNRMIFCPNGATSGAVPWNRWPQGRVPYVLNRNLISSMRTGIVQAITDFNRYTIIRWVPRVGNEVPYVSFESTRAGCFAWLGRKSSSQVQPVNLGTGCQRKGTVIHEMLHTVGFAHEQSRNDRDTYITINWANIDRTQWGQFQKMNANLENNQGFGYDFSSVMHYPSWAFTMNGKTTIVTKNSAYQSRIGQRSGFSSQDIKEVNKAYKPFASSTLFRVVAASGKDVYLHATAERDSESPTRLTELKSQLLGDDELTAQVFLADLDVRLDGSWTPMKVRGGLYATVQDGSHQGGARLEQKVFVEGDNQLFKFVPHADHDGFYSIVVKHSRKVLEHLPTIRCVVQNEWAGRRSQLWKVVQVEKAEVYEA